MISYRVYYCDARGKIFSAADFEAGDDPAAIERAVALVGGRAPIFEVWERDRFIHRHPNDAYALSRIERPSLEQILPDAGKII
jgi:hypothetical protein